jgi:hypothetical protein
VVQEDSYLTFFFAAMQCNAMRCGACMYARVYICVRTYVDASSIEIGDCRAVVLGRGALRRGWVGLGRRVVFIVLLPVLYRCVGWDWGVGVRLSLSLLL